MPIYDMLLSRCAAMSALYELAIGLRKNLWEAIMHIMVVSPSNSFCKDLESNHGDDNELPRKNMPTTVGNAEALSKE